MQPVYFATPKPPKGGFKTDSKSRCRKLKVPPGGFRGLPTSVRFLYSFLIAVIPGSFFPSMYSSMAPPPVDT